MQCAAGVAWCASAHPYVKMHAREGRGKSSEQRAVSCLIKELGCEVGSKFRLK